MLLCDDSLNITTTNNCFIPLYNFIDFLYSNHPYTSESISNNLFLLIQRYTGHDMAGGKAVLDGGSVLNAGELATANLLCASDCFHFLIVVAQEFTKVHFSQALSLLVGNISCIMWENIGNW